MQKHIKKLTATVKNHQALGKALSVSFLNQVISSGTNFALGILLVRILTPTDFGLYGIGLAISFFYSGIGNALFLTQMVVHTPDKTPSDREPYAARMFFALFGFNTIAFILFVTIFNICAYFSNWSNENLNYGLAVCTVALTFLIKDFFIRHAYIIQRENRAFACNVSIAITVLILLCGIIFFNIQINATIALSIYATGQMIGAFTGFILSRLPYKQVNIEDVLNDLHIAWHGGRWALGGVTVTWLQSQAYMYITAFFLGPVGVGQANAARLLISPFQFIIPAINQITMPRLAAQRNSNISGMIMNGRRYTLLILVLAFAYCITLYCLYDMVFSLIIGPRYSNLETLVLIWCFVLIAQLAKDGASTMLQALKEFRILTLMNIVSAIFAVTASALFSWKFGGPGAVLGTGFGEVILAILLWLRIRKHG